MESADAEEKQQKNTAESQEVLDEIDLKEFVPEKAQDSEFDSREEWLVELASKIKLLKENN